MIPLTLLTPSPTILAGEGAPCYRSMWLRIRVECDGIHQQGVFLPSESGNVKKTINMTLVK